MLLALVLKRHGRNACAKAASAPTNIRAPKANAVAKCWTYDSPTERYRNGDIPHFCSVGPEAIRARVNGARNEEARNEECPHFPPPGDFKLGMNGATKSATLEPQRVAMPTRQEVS
jgi:hypothetical protein